MKQDGVQDNVLSTRIIFKGGGSDFDLVVEEAELSGSGGGDPETGTTSTKVASPCGVRAKIRRDNQRKNLDAEPQEFRTDHGGAVPSVVPGTGSPKTPRSSNRSLMMTSVLIS